MLDGFPVARASVRLSSLRAIARSKSPCPQAIVPVHISALARVEADDSTPFVIAASSHRRPSLRWPRAYQKRQLAWDQYAKGYLSLLDGRDIASSLDRSLLAGPTALLCAEPTAERCHRRLAVEYLAAAWGGLTPIHL